MKAINEMHQPKTDFTGILFYFILGLLALSFLGMIGYVAYSFFA